MKWIAVVGSWRHSPDRLKRDVSEQVNKILHSGNGILTGGALGVDYLATQIVMNLDPTLKKLKVILPTDLDTYAKHYKKRAKEGVITKTQAKSLIKQLVFINNTRPEALIEGQNGLKVDQTSYYARNTLLVDQANEVYAFQVNKSAGTQNAIDTAKIKGKKATFFSYKT